MKKIFLAGLAATALVSSCSDDLATQGGGNLKENTIGASVSAEGTRAAFDNSGKFYWSKGDKLGIWVSQTASGNAATKALEASMAETDAGKESATFTVVSTTTDYSYAVYPYSESHTLNGNTLTYVFPTEYNYTQVDQTFFPENKDGNSFNPAMAGPVTKTDGNNNATLNHLGGVFCIKLDKMPCQSGTLVVSSDNAMTGSYTAEMNNTTPALSNSSATASDNNKTVAIKFSNASTTAPGVFYVPVPTGSFNNVRIKLYETQITAADASGSETAKVNTVAGSYTIDRKDLRVMSLTTTQINAGVTNAADVSAANSSLASSDNVAITSEVASGSTITIPAASASTTTTTKAITLEQVSSGATITVAEASGTEAGKANDVVVSLPHPASDDVAANLTINTPNSTVTLKGNAGLTTIKKVTASTADNTLIVTDGVTIDELEIAKGNVRINKGATVKKIALASGNSAADVYYEKGSTVTAPSDDTQISMYEIGVGVNPITNETQFAAAVANGGEYTLLKDLTLNKAYTVASKLTLNLNNKTLTAGTNTIETINGSLTLKNGSVVQHKGNNDVGLHVGTNGTLVVDGITYTGDENCFNRIYTLPCQKNVSVTIKNSTIKGGYYSFFTDASTKSGDLTGVTSNCTVNLENSEFIANETGVVVNIPATVTMKNCKSSGNHQGALLRGGTYNISDCTFTLNASLESTNKENKWMTAWTSGNQCAFAALTIGNYKNGAYAYETKATFTGTNKAIVTGTNATSYPAIHVCSNNNYAVTITGFKDNMKTEGGKTQAIEYGTTGITVDGTAVTANVNTATTTESK